MTELSPVAIGLPKSMAVIVEHDGMLEAGRQLLAWQSYEVRDHVASGDAVVTRMRWGGELAVDAGAWPAGTWMSAWCVAHYRLAAGPIVRIEQHDRYEQPSLPEPRGSDPP